MQFCCKQSNQIKSVFFPYPSPTPIRADVQTHLDNARMSSSCNAAAAARSSSFSFGAIRAICSRDWPRPVSMACSHAAVSNARFAALIPCVTHFTRLALYPLRLGKNVRRRRQSTRRSTEKTRARKRVSSDAARTYVCRSRKDASPSPRTPASRWAKLSQTRRSHLFESTTVC